MNDDLTAIPCIDIPVMSVDCILSDNFWATNVLTKFLYNQYIHDIFAGFT